MRTDDIRKLREAVPFSAFNLVLADGRSFSVPHPDFLSIAPKGTALVLWAENGGIESILDAALIAELRMGATAVKRSKRRRA